MPRHEQSQHIRNGHDLEEAWYKIPISSIGWSYGDVVLCGLGKGKNKLEGFGSRQAHVGSAFETCCMPIRAWSGTGIQASFSSVNP